MDYLNNDELYYIFEYLSAEEIVRQCQTNKNFRNYCQHPLIRKLIVDKRINELIPKTKLNKRFSNVLDQILLDTVRYDEPELVEGLLDRGANPAVNNNLAIIYASETGNLDIVDLLLQYPQVDPSAHNNRAIYVASGAGFADIVFRLLQDPRVDPVDYLNNALNNAVINNRTDVLDVLFVNPKVIDYLDQGN